jgi:ATP-dependent Lhr-like helicase
VRRFAAAHGPFAPEDVVERYALSREHIEPILAELETDGILARGRFVKGRGTQSAQLCDRRNLAELHRRTLALLRDRGAPATPAQLASFLLARHRAADVPGAAALLAGLRAPWEVLERDLLRRRLRGYQPALLDAACATGQVAWWLEGTRAALAPREELAVWWEPGSVEDLSPAETAVLVALDRDGAQFGSDLLRSTKLPAAPLFQALWSLARRGLVANDAWDALRRAAALDFEPTSADLHPANTVDALRRAVKNARPTPWVGRFARLSPMPLSHEERAARQAETLLRRYGVVGKAVADAEPGTVPWPLLEEALRRLELRGEAVRGFFVEGLGPYQLARADTVDELRSPRDPNELALVNACDPCLPSTYLVLRGGAPLLRVEAHGRRITPLHEAPDEVVAAGLSLLAELLLVPATLRAVRSVTVHKFGESDAAAAEPLFLQAGFRRDGDRMVLGILDAEKTLRR